MRYKKRRKKTEEGEWASGKIFTKMKNTIHNTKLVLRRQTNKAEDILGRSQKGLHCGGWGHCERILRILRKKEKTLCDNPDPDPEYYV